MEKNWHEEYLKIRDREIDRQASKKYSFQEEYIMSDPVKTNLNLGNLKSDLLDLASKLNIDDGTKEVFVQAIILKVAGNLSATRERLAILYEYEKNYLELIQEYKEEMVVPKA
jgi:hypothetical protein